ncbi:hypothetical protein JTB14_000299 [Gonioctena quinquepunctata]|nr:hypothetical protein JTB14_000299 [Gonioctena quinquepunctata]
MDTINVYYPNFRGLRIKLREIKLNIEKEDYDIIKVEENTSEPELQVEENNVELPHAEGSEINSGVQKEIDTDNSSEINTEDGFNDKTNIVRMMTEPVIVEVRQQFDDDVNYWESLVSIKLTTTQLAYSIL